MSNSRRIIAACVLLWGICVSPAGMANSAQEVMQAYKSGLSDLSLIWSDLSVDDRRKRIVKLIGEHFAEDVMFQHAMGSRLRTLTRAQRDRLETAFSLFLRDRVGERTIESRISEFDIRDARPLPEKRWFVRTNLSFGNATSAQFDYILARHSGRLRIINFLRDGVSEMALWRTEFARVMDSRGIDELARRMGGVTSKSKRASK